VKIFVIEDNGKIFHFSLSTLEKKLYDRHLFQQENN